MTDLNPDLARLARDAMLELAGQGTAPSPSNYRRSFERLRRERGISAPDEEMALPPEMLAGEVGDLLAGLARVATRSAPALKEVLAALRDSREGGLTRAEVVGHIDAVQAASAAEPESSGGGAGAALERLAEVARAVVPALDPNGQHRDEAIGQLKTLSSARSLDDANAAISWLVGFATSRRQALGEELREARGAGVRDAALVELATTCMQFVGNAFEHLPEVQASFSAMSTQVPGADTVGVRGMRDEIASRMSELGDLLKPLQQQKNVIKGVLRSLAEQLNVAAAGSDEYAQQTQGIRDRLEAASSLSELRELQDVLIEQTVQAGKQAVEFRDQANALGEEVRRSQSQINALERALSESREAMNLDPLTRVSNRRGLQSWAERELFDESGALVRSFALLVLDLDHFKLLNDEHGHLGGDRALVETARRLKMGIRDIDYLARFGGEEFVLVLPDCDLRIGAAVADRLCLLLSRKPLVHEGKPMRVTTSIGVAVARPGETLDQTFERADQCVYVAKNRGRNQAVTEAALEA